MSLNRISETMLPELEDELKRFVFKYREPHLDGLLQMLAYHMGWEGPGAGPEARGKRIRPLLVLLSADSAGGDWRKAIPGAVAVELVHNFSLVHDDIEDCSSMRRGRQTVWSIWGVPQALNAGDTLFSLAQLAIFGLAETVSEDAGLAAARTLQETCLHLTQGQYLDLSYELRRDLTEADYWPMVAGKTAALISACTKIGALAAQAKPEACEAYRRFGELLGLAFQVQDDQLGIWGDSALTGKSTGGDLVSGKKSLPVLFGLGRRGSFAARWSQGPIQPDEVVDLAAQLEAEGSLAYVQEQSDRLTHDALQALAEAKPKGEAGDALVELANKLLKRKM